MKRLTRLALASALLAGSTGAWSQDLLTVWRAAAGHDQRLAVARAEHGASQTLREQADALWRPQVGLNVGLGLGAQETAMRGARFSAPGMGQIDEARFATSVTGGLSTRVAVMAQQPLINAAREAQQAQMRLGADMGDTAWRGAQADLALRTTERYFALAVAQERVRVVERQLAAVTRSRTEAHDRYQLGASPVTDTHEADAALAGVRAQQSAARLELGVQRDRLAGSTGLAQPTARLPAQPPAPVDDLPAWLAAAEADHPRLRLLMQAVAVAEQKLRQHSVAGRATVNFDLSDLRGTAYHTGLMFAAYAPGWSDALARGGRYDNVGDKFGRARPATGFSLDLRDLVRVLPQRSPATGIRVAGADAGRAREAIAALRAAGEVLVIDYLGESAAALNCDRALVWRADGWQVEPFASH